MVAEKLILIFLAGGWGGYILLTQTFMDCFINYPHYQMFIIKRHVIKDFIDKTIAHKLPHALEAVIFAKSKQNIFLA